MEPISERQDGLFVRTLYPGTIIDLETHSRRYRIEYLSGDAVRISGHPSWCPAPVEMKLEGSMRGLDHLERGFIGRGMRLVFTRPEEGLSVTTSEILSVRISEN
jgi:hypothetical protein